MANVIMDVIDDGDLRKYRTEIPNMLDDSDLSVYAFRLYVHLKRVAGDKGQCFQGSRAIAKQCNMSPTSVVSAKHELLGKGLIRLQPGDPATSRPDAIRIANIWTENFNRFTPRSISEHPAPIESTPARQVDRPRSPIEHPARVVEQKKEQEQEGTKKEGTKKEETKDRGSRDKSHSPKLTDEDYLNYLQAKPAYAKIDVRHVYAKMSVWCEAKGKQPTKTRLINWLNREDQPLEGNGNGHKPYQNGKPAITRDFSKYPDPK